MKKIRYEASPALEEKTFDSAPRDTIFALSSGAGVAAVAVIRLSGPLADTVLLRLTGGPLPPPRHAVLRDLKDEAGEFIDQALILRFANGASYTGESVAEFHCHGGRAVVAAVLEALGRQPGCRMAEPGEFTRRAFEAGRMDLAKVEALGDLLAAETELQRRQAARVLGGALHRQTDLWREKLIRAAALVEVTIDWVDEEVPENVVPEVAQLLSEVWEGIAHELSISAGAERMRQGFEVAILGSPNAGKSSLFNMLAGREAAIASAQPGTTRDVLELRYDLAGLPVVFLDTAGLRETSSEIEAIGVSRAADRASSAAMRLFLRCKDAPPHAVEELLWQPGDLRIWTKSDLYQGPGDLNISALRGDGVQEMLRRICAELSARHPADGLVGHLRQRRSLQDAVGALARAKIGVNNCEAEAVAEDIRTALRVLERLIGRVGVEDILGTVFASFCLGK